jgi:hypothetical protein
MPAILDFRIAQKKPRHLAGDNLSKASKVVLLCLYKLGPEIQSVKKWQQSIKNSVCCISLYLNFILWR